MKYIQYLKAVRFRIIIIYKLNPTQVYVVNFNI